MKSSVFISIIIVLLAFGPIPSSTKFANVSSFDLLHYADLLNGAIDRGCMDIGNLEDCLVLANLEQLTRLRLTKRSIPQYSVAAEPWVPWVPGYEPWLYDY